MMYAHFLAIAAGFFLFFTNIYIDLMSFGYDFCLWPIKLLIH